jgi:hypothetical protein
MQMCLTFWMFLTCLDIEVNSSTSELEWVVTTLLKLRVSFVDTKFAASFQVLIPYKSPYSEILKYPKRHTHSAMPVLAGQLMVANLSQLALTFFEVCALQTLDDACPAT